MPDDRPTPGPPRQTFDPETVMRRLDALESRITDQNQRLNRIEQELKGVLSKARDDRREATRIIEMFGGVPSAIDTINDTLGDTSDRLERIEAHLFRSPVPAPSPAPEGDDPCPMCCNTGLVGIPREDGVIIRSACPQCGRHNVLANGLPVPGTPAPKGDEAKWEEIASAGHDAYWASLAKHHGTTHVERSLSAKSEPDQRAYLDQTQAVVAKAIELGFAAPAGSIPRERLVVTDAMLDAAGRAFRDDASLGTRYSMRCALEAAIAQIRDGA
jgi:hypothetical protein